VKSGEHMDVLARMRADVKKITAIRNEVQDALKHPEDLRAKELLDLREECEELVGVLKDGVAKYFPAMLRPNS
jgi:hypothetical protein